MIVFTMFLITLIFHHASPAAVEKERAGTIQGISTSNIPQENFQYQYPQQVFHIYNSYCDGQKPIPKIPDGYTLTPGVGAHKLHAEKKNWNDARNICIKEGAHLAVINSAEEEKLYKNAAHQLNAEQMWFGIHDQFNEGDWVTVLDKPVNDLPYKHWILNNPNNDFNSENCGTYWKPHDGWNDARCDGLFPFYCEIDLS